jgi:hypothetical protein
MPGGGCRIPATSLIGGVGLEQIAATSLDVPPGSECHLPDLIHF